MFAVTQPALEMVSKEDTHGIFEACGYDTSQDHSLRKSL
jgi:hypothetical protein